MASDSSTRYVVNDVFKEAQELGIKVIRTWGFNSNSDSTKNSVIRYHPYNFKEEGLQSLDYVIYKAKQYNVKLVFVLENNFSDFGGIPQYIDWANQLLTPVTGKLYKHNDFFSDDSIKSWYRYYIETLLKRENSYTSILYKNEPAIFSFELINEASNTGFQIDIINKWYIEMADFFKSLDSNHLLTTGEIGYDIYKYEYSDWDFFYNSSQFLFNGYKGTSFIENSSITGIDYSSFHLYPDAWGFEPLAGNTWITDHVKISNNFEKPALLGEFGLRNEKLKNYEIYLETIRASPSRSAIIWNYVHPDIMYIADDYAFNEIQNPELIDLFDEHLQLLKDDSIVFSNTNFILYQNYPNPFNPTTIIKYSLMKDEHIKIELFNYLGESVQIIDEGMKEAGTHTLFLSFDNNLLSSGIYFYRLQAGSFVETKKMVLMK
jgi:mannan endo-1,4-beta-mannosidase